MGSNIVFSSLCLNMCLRFGCHLDIVMLLLLGNTFLMVRFVAVVLGLPGSCIWRRMIWWHLTFSNLSHIRCHTWAYFRSDEIYRSWGSCVLILICEMYVEMMIYSLSSRWFLSEAYREPSSQARAFRCLDVVMLPSEGRLFDMWVWFGCRHRWFELIYFFDMLHSRRHIGAYSPFSVEMWRSPTILHDHPQLWDIRQVDDSTSFCADTPRSLSWVV